MLELRRTVRFCLNDPAGLQGEAAPAGGASEPDVPRHNTFSAWPAMRGLGRFYELHVCCQGEADPVTGYFMNIKEIDAAVREHALPHMQSLLAGPSPSSTIAMGTVMRDLLTLLQEPLDGSVIELSLGLSPYHQIGIRSQAMSHVVVRQQYEFAAAHRLHCEELSEDENRRIFGKCNNPSGHGHNYRLEVVVQAPIDGNGHMPFVETLDALVDSAVIEKLDHKHLDLDVEEFATMNTSVENIARVIFDLLTQAMRTTDFELEEVSVWETEKTVCTYRGARQAAPA